ncbi:MAG: hypothetical protein PUC30_06720 [Lachnospiraceae bacterium]|nr:hypothetical protein [Lachnospiraceae bacterium]
MKKRFFAALMAAVMLLGIGGDILWNIPQAQAASSYSNLVVSEGTSTQIALVPGETIQVDIPVRAKQDAIFYPTFSVELPENSPLEIGKIESYRIIGGQKVMGASSVSRSLDTYLCFFITTKETAKIGKYDFKIQYESHYSDGSVMDEGDSGYLKSITLTGVVSEEKLPAELAISALKVTGEAKPGKTVDISFTVTNTGEIEAKSVRLSADYSSGLMIPDYTEYTRKLGDMKQKEARQVTLRVKILENVMQNVVQLPLIISYKDSDGASYTADANNILYLEVTIPEKEEEKPVETGTMLVNNVRQTPASPKAGQKVSLTFDMENTGERDFTDTKLYINYTSNTGFEPVNAEPYQYVGTVKAGQKKSVTVTVIAGKDIAAGMNSLGINYTYLDNEKNEISDNVNLYVLDVQEKEESMGNSKPKLMVSEFSTSLEQIKSGEEFDFSFDVYNTHSETAAKNIKVTVTSEMFSVTKGSNSFFMQEIRPGESESITINLKASAAAMTGSYPINIQMEYEYDGMPSTEANGNGIVVTETKMLLIKENLRVSVENVMVGGWNTPYANQTTQLSFSIYNMGKSTLNNVYFTVEGDFAVANGSSYYYGTLQAGYPDYVEMDITPLVSGDAAGTLTIHMEDSNGDEVTYESELSAFIMEMGGGDIGWDVPDIPTDVNPIPVEPQVQVKPIVSVPVFAVILVVVFLISLFVARGIRIACYKRKLRREER